MDGWMMDGWIDGWMDGGWMDAWMDAWMDERLSASPEGLNLINLIMKTWDRATSTRAVTTCEKFHAKKDHGKVQRLVSQY